MYLSFSGFKQFWTCPRSYWHGYIDKTPLPSPENRVNSLYGIVVGRLFEVFYAESLWRSSDTVGVLLGKVDQELDHAISKETRSGVLNWKDKKANYDSREALVEDIREAIPRGIATIRHHKLVGVDAKAELKLDARIEGHIIGGRADFVMTRVSPHGDTVILDGKGSRHREAYIDDRQLLWYAMLYRVHYGKTPDKLGFVYWRSEPDESLDWLLWTDADVDRLRETVFEYIRQIEDGMQSLSKEPEDVRRLVMLETFQARPGKKCSLCAYASVCPEGKFFMKPMDIPKHDGVGIEDIGLD